MKSYFTFIIFSVIITGCGSVRHSFSSGGPIVQLKNDINTILGDSIFASTSSSLKIVSVNDGELLYENNSKKLFHPASNMKLLTAAAALSILDTGYHYRTSVYVKRYIQNSDVVRNLYLKGYGDPDLSSTDLDSLAQAVRQAGITTVLKDIIVDDFIFDGEYWGSGWMWDDEADPDAPSINALSVNKNCIDVSLLSDSSTTFVYLEPLTNFVTVINNAKIVSDSIRKQPQIKYFYENNQNVIITEGELSSFNQIKKRVSLRNPEYYAGFLFKESLQHAGVTVGGEVINGEIPTGLPEIARLERPIEKVITNMNKISDNLSAENTLKIIGITKYGYPGSSKNGVFAVNKFLSDLGIDTMNCTIADGSGVSRYNLLNADQLVQLLVSVIKEPRISSVFYNSLPIAGVDGTLSSRMTAYPAACNVHAKTGTLNGVSCLSGYVETRDHELLAFSIMMQNFIKPTYDYRLAQDRICELLAGFSRK